MVEVGKFNTLSFVGIHRFLSDEVEAIIGVRLRLNVTFWRGRNLSHITFPRPATTFSERLLGVENCGMSKLGPKTRRRHQRLRAPERRLHELRQFRRI